MWLERPHCSGVVLPAGKRGDNETLGLCLPVLTADVKMTVWCKSCFLPEQRRVMGEFVLQATRTLQAITWSQANSLTHMRTHTCTSHMSLPIENRDHLYLQLHNKQTSTVRKLYSFTWTNTGIEIAESQTLTERIFKWDMYTQLDLK